MSRDPKRAALDGSTLAILFALVLEAKGPEFRADSICIVESVVSFYYLRLTLEM